MVTTTESIADELRAIDTGEEPAVVQGQTEQAELLPPEKVFKPISEDAFWEAFRVVHTLLGGAIRSHAIRMGPEMQGAREASKALYETACQTPSLHWLVEPGNEQMMRWFAIASYGLGMLRAVQAEVHERRRLARPGPLSKPGSENHVVREFHAPAPGEAVDA